MAKIRKRKWTTPSGEVRSSFAVDYSDSNGNRQRRQFKTKAEADNFRVEIEGQLKTGTYRADASKITVKDVADDFLRYCEGRMKRNERMTRRCYNLYEGHIHNYICPDPQRHIGERRHKKLRTLEEGIGGIKLAQLTTRRVSEFRDRVRDAGVSVTTTRKIIGTLKLVLGFAISRDLVAVNAASGVKVIGRRDEGPKKIIPPTKEDIRRLLDVADEDFRVKLMFAAATGVRAGELHALRWHHIDFDKAMVKIETRVDSYGEEDVTKTAAGMRDVPLGVSVITALKAWKLRSKRKKPEELVFPSKRGWYVGHDNMIKRKFNPLFEALAKKHEEDPNANPPAPDRFNWHALRHFAISCWIEAGLKPKTVQTFAGHSSLQVTMDRYGHLFQSDDHQKAMDAIARDLFA
jgi:integrase